MSKLRVRSFSVSLDGFGAGSAQDLEHPLGVGGAAVHEWLFATRTFQKMTGKEGGATGVDDDFFARGFAGIGARILELETSVSVEARHREEAGGTWSARCEPCYRGGRR